MRGEGSDGCPLGLRGGHCPEKKRVDCLVRLFGRDRPKTNQGNLEGPEEMGDRRAGFGAHAPNKDCCPVTWVDPGHLAHGRLHGCTWGALGAGDAVSQGRPLEKVVVEAVCLVIYPARAEGGAGGSRVRPGTRGSLNKEQGGAGGGGGDRQARGGGAGEAGGGGG